MVTDKLSLTCDKGHCLNLLKDVIVLPVLVAGEKKLKTGEKMVPSRVVRGGLLAASTGASNLPFGFMGLLLQVMVSKKR